MEANHQGLKGMATANHKSPEGVEQVLNGNYDGLQEVLAVNDHDGTRIPLAEPFELVGMVVRNHSCL